MTATCRFCGRHIPLVGPGLQYLRRHRKYARRADGLLVGPAGNVCPGSSLPWREATSDGQEALL